MEDQTNASPRKINSMPTTASKLYLDDAEQMMQIGLMSTGERVDLVYVYEKKADKPAADTHAHQLEFFEDYLVGGHLHRCITEYETQLAAATSEDERKRLQDLLDSASSKLEHTAVKLEKEIAKNGETVFVKVHAPFKVVCMLAEEASLRMPLRLDSSSCLTEITSPLDPLYKMLNPPKDIDQNFYSAKFTLDNLVNFRGGDDPAKYDDMFSPAQRSMLLFNKLESTPLTKSDMNQKCEKGVGKLISNGTVLACFPLHDSDPHVAPVKDSAGERHFLHQNWAGYKNVFRPQPLGRIRRYFGERIALHFAWLGFYTQCLFVPALVGLIVFFYGLGGFRSQSDGDAFCASNLTMCALCDGCSQWQLSDACVAYRAQYVFDNSGTVAFAFLMSLWASLFLEFWKRKQATLAYEWDVRDLAKTESQRPYFTGKTVRKNPITDRPEQYFPSTIRLRRVLVSSLVVVLMINLVIWSVIGSVIFRLAVQEALYDSNDARVQTRSAVITSALAAILSVVVLLILSLIHERLAIKLTEWENHEKQTDHDFHLALKIFLFEFVNNFSPIFYVAFFQGRFAGYPGNRTMIWGFRQDECPEYGCLLELTIQLAVMMLGKQWALNFLEMFVPWVHTRWSKWAFTRNNRAMQPACAETGSCSRADSRWEADFNSSPWPELGHFYEGLEVVTQFGFITLFVAAFPLGPLFALLNNLFEIRGDAFKLTALTRRPIAYRAQNIGVWYPILSSVAFISVVTNGCIIAFSSSFIPKIVFRHINGDMDGYIESLYSYSPVLSGDPAQIDCYYEGFRDNSGTPTLYYYRILAARLAFLLVFEHLVFFISSMIRHLVPDVPAAVAIQIERENYFGRQATAKEFMRSIGEAFVKPT